MEDELLLAWAELSHIPLILYRQNILNQRLLVKFAGLYLGAALSVVRQCSSASGTSSSASATTCQQPAAQRLTPSVHSITGELSYLPFSPLASCGTNEIHHQNGQKETNDFGLIVW
jgi:hypothetical protein